MSARPPIPAHPDAFDWEGRRIAYTEYGEGDRVVVLIHGLLLAQKMHRPLAKALARRGLRAVTIDVLGHGASDRPTDMTEYSMERFGKQVIGLLDHLEVPHAVLVGTSLGANTALEAAVLAPDRVCGIVPEMPVLDHALLGASLAFTPLMTAIRFARIPLRLLARGARIVPTQRLWLADVALDTVRQDPEPSGAVLQGLFFGRVAPHRDVRKTITTPTLVIGHESDPIHPFDDADSLAREIPGARLVRATSLLELRIAPQRLTNAIAVFCEQCFEAVEAGENPSLVGATPRDGSDPRTDSRAGADAG